MKLTELDPVFLIRASNDSWHRIDSLAEADGILFLCPVCFKTNSGPIGTHSIICWRPRVPAETLPGPGRWEFQGSSYTDLTSLDHRRYYLRADATLIFL